MVQTEAYIIGGLSKGIFWENGIPYIISGGVEPTKHALTGYEWSQIRFLKSEYYSEEYSSLYQLGETINNISLKTEGLEMAIELMDSNLSDEYRSELAKLLGSQVEKNTELFVYIKNRLLSTPVPNELFPENAYSFIQSFSSKMADLYQGLREKTKSFGAFYTLLKFELNLNYQVQEYVDQFLTDEGLYTKFSEALYEKSRKNYHSAGIETLKALKNMGVSYNPNIFLEIEKQLSQNYRINLSDTTPQVNLTNYEFASEQENDEIKLLIEEYFLKMQAEHDKKKVKRGFGKKVEKYQEDILDVVEKLKGWVKTHANKGDEAFLNEFKDVVKKQLKSSKPEQLCKTCCDLATFFIGNLRFALAQKLLEYAKLLNSEDPVIYSQIAELYRKQGKFKNALEAYNYAIQKSNDVVDYSGKAETFRDMGKSEEALAQYDLTIEKFDDVVAYSGKAEVLRDMGKSEEALAQYDLTIEKFDNVVAYSGKAEVLRDMGKSEAALAQYDLTIEKFDDVVAYSGKAEVLRDMGKSEEALAQYDLTIEKFDNVVAYSGKAEVLRDMGKPEEALKQYDLTIEKFDNVFAYNGKAETLRDMGKSEEALGQYDLTIKKFDDVVAYSGKAETLRDMGKSEAALKLYNLIIEKFDHVVAYCGKAEVLRDMGKPEEALKQYDLTIEKFDNAAAYNGKSEALKDMGRIEDSFNLYKKISFKYKYNNFTTLGLYRTMLEVGKLDELRNYVVKPIYITSFDYSCLNMYALLLIKEGDWEQANEVIKKGLESPFKKNILYFKGLASYLKILKREYNQALAYFDNKKPKTPPEILLIVHAYSENDKNLEAKEILRKIDHIKRPVISSTVNYLSERYLLNGFKKSGKLKEELDKLILEGELKAMLQY
jgi:tetratricopeptide (TPR) repeat protein